VPAKNRFSIALSVYWGTRMFGRWGAATAAVQLLDAVCTTAFLCCIPYCSQRVASWQQKHTLWTPISRDTDTLLIVPYSRCASCTLSCSALALAVQTAHRR
jgi:hypothetical protein